MGKSYQPVIIIGAGRSGTNMLRDILTKLPHSGTWPCDEINYIWRHGNIRVPHDEFTKIHATARVQSYIRNQFDKIARKYKLNVLIEKTCANALRVEFVHQIIPNAKYIHIIRDARDVVASAKLRWTAPLDIPYIAKKARYVPITDIPYYAFKYLGNRIYRLFSREKRLAFWGPKFNGIEEALNQYSLEEVCAIQWKKCVDNADAQLSAIDETQVYQLYYEDFVTSPKEELIRLCTFLDIDLAESDAEELIRGVSSKSVGKAKETLDPQTLAAIQSIAKDTMERHGYLVK